MCQIMEEVKNESFAEGREEGREEGIAQERERVRESSIKKARKMIQDGKLSLEEVSQYTDLSLQEVQELAATV